MERSRWLSIRDTLPNPADARYPVRLPNREHAQHYLQILFNAALSVLRDRAYTPYYPQFEATAILCNDGKLVAATPRQDASYQHERSVAVALAQIDATRSRIIEAVLFMFDGDSIDKPRFPDGRSRQMLFEAAQVAGNDFTVFAASTSGQIWLTTISELLPFAFGPADLGIDVSKYR
jgi:cytidine deaminase